MSPYLSFPRPASECLWEMCAEGLDHRPPGCSASWLLWPSPYLRGVRVPIFLYSHRPLDTSAFLIFDKWKAIKYFTVSILIFFWLQTNLRIYIAIWTYGFSFLKIAHSYLLLYCYWSFCLILFDFQEFCKYLQN